jgi:hypothetical protein
MIDRKLLFKTNNFIYVVLIIIINCTDAQSARQRVPFRQSLSTTISPILTTTSPLIMGTVFNLIIIYSIVSIYKPLNETCIKITIFDSIYRIGTSIGNVYWSA